MQMRPHAPLFSIDPKITLAEFRGSRLDQMIGQPVIFSLGYGHGVSSDDPHGHPANPAIRNPHKIV